MTITTYEATFKKNIVIRHLCESCNKISGLIAHLSTSFETGNANKARDKSHEKLINAQWDLSTDFKNAIKHNVNVTDACIHCKSSQSWATIINKAINTKFWLQVLGVILTIATILLWSAYMYAKFDSEHAFWISLFAVAAGVYYSISRGVLAIFRYKYKKDIELCIKGVDSDNRPRVVSQNKMEQFINELMGEQSSGHDGTIENPPVISESSNEKIPGSNIVAWLCTIIPIVVFFVAVFVIISNLAQFGMLFVVVALLIALLVSVFLFFALIFVSRIILHKYVRKAKK